MLIPLSDLVHRFGLKISGVLHIGAHECEESLAYSQCGVNPDDVLWLEGNKDLVHKMKQRVPSTKIHHVVVSDTDNKDVSFIVTNNYQSSSILELENHKVFYPGIHEIARQAAKTKTVDTFFVEQNEPMAKYNFVNIDIQGAELLALKGMTKFLTHVDYLYLEVNDTHLYKDGALMSEIDDYLRPLGFTRVETVMTAYKWGDALYIKK